MQGCVIFLVHAHSSTPEYPPEWEIPRCMRIPAQQINTIQNPQGSTIKTDSSKYRPEREKIL